MATMRLNTGSYFGIFVFICLVSVQGNRYDWMGYDRFDEMEEVYNSVDDANCPSKTKDAMFMREDVVTQIPRYNTLLSQVWYKNRTSLIHLHNMALNRAFFFSYILQKMNDTKLFYIQPNWIYMYFSVAADVNANPYGINASAIYFDTNCSYPNWYVNVPFNDTLPLFGPKAYRWDDYQDQDNFLREPTRKVVAVTDIGAGLNSNYTQNSYKMNPWYSKWLPDIAGDEDSATKFTYSIGIKYSNVTGQFQNEEFKATPFLGPPLPGQQDTDDKMMPVSFTKPYFDCGEQNKWMFSATSPIVDYMPRYSNWTHLRRPRAVGVIVMDIDWDMVDFNSCGVSPGNPGPSYLAGIARCKAGTTCKNKIGYGFMRGGYVCVCKPGKRYPVWIDPPFQGEHIEQATDVEYKTGFQCSEVQHRQVLAIVDQKENVQVEGMGGVSSLRFKRDASGIKLRTLKSFNETFSDNISPVSQHNLDTKTDTKLKFKPTKRLKSKRTHQNTHQNEEHAETKKPKKQKVLTRAQKLKFHTRRKRAVTYDYSSFEKMMRIFRQIKSVTKENCHTLSPGTKHLPGSVAYGVDKQFEVEARTALRLAHFLSNYLQNTGPDENYGTLRGGGRLHMEHLFGEVFANVMGNPKILSSGVFYDTNKFEYQDGTRKEYFGPLAYKEKGSYNSIDSAGLPTPYVYEDWFIKAKSRWTTNTEQLKKFKLRPHIRSNPAGESRTKFEHFPLTYRAPEYKDGYWTNPKFKCDGRVDEWAVTYVVPFFGLDSLRRKLQFKGVVTVDVPLVHLEINQCPQPFHVANAFKNTARCDLESTNCRPMAGFKFARGSYRCDCKEGYEYMHLDNKFWFVGSLIELEYEKKVRGLFSKFDDMRCRIAGGATISSTFYLLIVSLTVSLFTY